MKHDAWTRRSPAWLEPLSVEECMQLLRDHSVGRISVTVDGGPFIMPVNYRLAESPRGTWVVLRTRPGSVIERASMRVAFQIDEIEPARREGWSVLVRGTMRHVDTEAAEFTKGFDPEPWMPREREAWLVIEPYAITGRRLHAAEREWPFYVGPSPAKKTPAKKTPAKKTPAKKTPAKKVGGAG